MKIWIIRTHETQKSANRNIYSNKYMITSGKKKNLNLISYLKEVEEETENWRVEENV